VIVGFAGSVGDAFTLLERLSGRLEQHEGDLLRSAQDLAKEWRTDRTLRPLQSMMIAVDDKHTLLLTGTGEVIEPDDGVIGIGSGGALATAAARALAEETDLDAETIVEKSLRIAANICVFTNQQIRIEKIQHSA
jgi:ATP-dependent HslUV protease subunit HslV